MKSEKHIAGATFLCIALLFLVAPQSHAIIRSPYPAKSLPPYRGHVTTIATGAISVAAKNGH